MFYLKSIYCLCLGVMLAVIPIGKKGHFTFNEETHDYGKILHERPATTIFTFKNTGDTPIIIFEVKPVCGCTIADYTKSPVKKNQTGFIKITFHAILKQGFNKAIVIHSNTDTPTKLLTIKGEVY